ncbi:hypothetical protein Avbf_06740 [Armadillidium vulgare]|nr:hypothetical protein Avbf_06740 [Armadillidium vulgare]
MSRIYKAIGFLNVNSEKTAIVDSEKIAIVGSEKTALVDSEKTSLVDSEKTALFDSEKTALVDSEKTALLDNVEQSIYMAMFPYLYHITGKLLMSFAFYTGSKIVIFPKYSQDAFIDGIKKHKY